MKCSTAFKPLFRGNSLEPLAANLKKHGGFWRRKKNLKAQKEAGILFPASILVAGAGFEPATFGL
jgi:hypothetical protein